MPTPEIDVLLCSACGAPIPLAGASSGEARCPHCGASASLPAGQRELRAIEEQDEASRQRAQALFAGLDSPPSLLVRVLAAVFDQPGFLFWIFFGVPVGLASIFAGLAFDARWHQAPAVTVAVIFSALFGFAFLPRVLGIYAHRRAGGRRVLLAGLAAQRPRTPGGPARCRACGAPLDVLPGALVVRCGHCGADSAVVVRTPLLAKARRAARVAARTIDEAVAIDRRERAGTRRELVRELGRYALWTSIFGGLFAVFMWDDARATARDDGSAPALGITALVLGTFLLIGMLLVSAGRTPDGAAEESRLRRDESDLPGWVRTLGPVGFWVALWLLRWAIWR